MSRTLTPTLGVRPLACAFALTLLVACESGGGLSGTYTRALYGEGDLRMTVQGNTIQMELPSPRWPEEVDMQTSFTMKGDTLIFNETSEAFGCTAPEARYLVNHQEDKVSISRIGMDPCGARYAALAGTWTKS